VATTEEKTAYVRKRPRATTVLRLCYTGSRVVLPPSRHTPKRGATPIGREVKDGIVLAEDSRVSRHHATLHTDPLGNLRLVDEGSRNGTQVNGVRVVDHRLLDGDVVSIGDSHFVVRVEPDEQEDGEVSTLIGHAPSVRSLRAMIERIGPTTASALLLGESGTGKDVVARALHEASRPGRPFVAVNCAAIPESLAESQLFGHVAGAFSGAVARPGLFRAADGGTLFLDEVGELPEAIQPKLLRALQDHLITPVGATTPASVDVRIIAATNRDLDAAMSENKFRGDLFARLSEVPLTLPPLRARREDVLVLLMHALGSPAVRLAPPLAEALLLHAWPFNVREVLAIAAHLRITSRGASELDLDLVADRLDIPDDIATASTPPSARPSEEPQDREPPPDRAKLEALLREHRGVVADVARSMRRSRKQVYRWITAQGLDVRAYR
jgi:transcriptional regulator with GAF, ATPase, and Fis domain